MMIIHVNVNCAIFFLTSTIYSKIEKDIFWKHAVHVLCALTERVANISSSLIMCPIILDPGTSL